MEPEDIFYAAEDYVRTTTNNLVSRKATVHGPQNVSIKGKGIVMPGVTLHGDLATIRFGRYCLVDEGSTIRPGVRLEQGSGAAAAADANAKAAVTRHHTPMLVGNHTHIGRGCVVEAAAIGCNVTVGDGCVLGANCIIKDNCIIEAGTVLPPGAVVPPFTRVHGKPGLAVGEVPESFAVVQPERAIAFFNNFKRIS